MHCNAKIGVLVQVVLEEAGSRKVIFSTFDPDCATLLSLKQPRFPGKTHNQLANGRYMMTLEGHERRGLLSQAMPQFRQGGPIHAAKEICSAC